MRVLIGERYKGKLAQSLASQGIEPVWLPDDPALDPRLAGHADLLAFRSGRQIVLAESLFYLVPYDRTDIVNYLTILKNSYEVMPTRSPRGAKYPADAGLCVCDTGKYTIYDPKSIDGAVSALIGGVPVAVSQGYAKCAACVVDDHSIITADAGVSRAAKSAGMDVLDIAPGHIALDGYDYGFIGGASFQANNNTIAFTGTLDAHPDKERILRFLAEHGKQAVFLTDEPIFDIGGAVGLEALPQIRHNINYAEFLVFLPIDKPGSSLLLLPLQEDFVMSYQTEAPQVLREFLVYHDTIKGQSKKTVDSYFMDLRTFTRYLYVARDLVPRDTPLEDVDIRGADLDFYGSVTLAEVYDFLAYLSRDRELNASSRARMITSLKGFYRYLTVKTKQLKEDPVQDLDAPKLKKSLPHYLTLDESRRLLMAVDGKNKERDYCILCLFLNCGLRISEMVGLNLSDIRQDSLLIHGKGNKERVVYLNGSCIEALNAWLAIRKDIPTADKKAVFLSNRRTRMSVDSIQVMLHKALLKAGLDASHISPHKLRHTAATLMLQNGVDVRTLQEVLGHESLNTTQIYTHIANAELKKAAAANPLAGFTPGRADPEE